MAQVEPIRIEIDLTKEVPTGIGSCSPESREERSSVSSRAHPATLLAMVDAGVA
jgi:hypothetical protein